MRFNFSQWIALLVAGLVISGCPACQTDVVETELVEENITETIISTSYPLMNTPAPTIQVAYPITEEDLHLIFRTWEISSLFENGVPKEPGNKRLKFNQDGTYEIVFGENVKTGYWETWLYAAESTLIFDPGSPDALYYDIMELHEDELFLHKIIDGIHIDEFYLPAD
jgi:hypothetical protein